MANYELRNFNPELWAKATTRAKVEGWTATRLVEALFAGYVDGSIVPPGSPPRPPRAVHDGVVDIPFPCPKCNKELIVEVAASKGFAYMNFYAVDCPYCQAITER